MKGDKIKTAVSYTGPKINCVPTKITIDITHPKAVG